MKNLGRGERVWITDRSGREVVATIIRPEGNGAYLVMASGRRFVIYRETKEERNLKIIKGILDG